jgi:hypothetical protein
VTPQATGDEGRPERTFSSRVPSEIAGREMTRIE